MADHQAQEEGAKEPVGKEPVTQTPEASSDDKANQGLLNDLVKQRQRAAELEKQLAELQASQQAKAPAESTQPPQAPDSDKLLERLAQIEKRDQLRSLRTDHGLTAQQAEAVVDLMGQMPDLDANEAKTLAALRDPKVFAEDADAGGFDPAMHGASRPMPGQNPAQEAPQENYIEGVQKLMETDNRSGRRALSSFIGHVASQQVGRSGHKRVPLPKTQ